MIDQDQKNHTENTNEEVTSSAAHEQNPQESENQWKDQFLRVTADFQNYKKRAERERTEITKYAHMSIIEKLLPLIDDLERALTIPLSHSQNPEVKSWVDGLSLIDKKVRKFFIDLSIEEISCSGQFDPRFHEALIHVDAPDKKTGDIVEVLAKGYKMGDTIVRHAKVSVAK